MIGSVGDLTFEQYAVSHWHHPHCAECKGCILDLDVQHMAFVLCVGCRDEVKAKKPALYASWIRSGAVGWEKKLEGK